MVLVPLPPGPVIPTREDEEEEDTSLVHCMLFLLPREVLYQKNPSPEVTFATDLPTYAWKDPVMETEEVGKTGLISQTGLEHLHVCY